MRVDEFDEFAQLLDDAYDLIGSGANKVISGGAKSLFFAAMGPYSLAQFRAALSAHCLDKARGRFTPKPADIIEQIEASELNDGRPGAEEAWAIALTSLDEADTVVWSTECSEAFRIAKPVLVASGAISARKGFIEAYERLVAAARAARRPVEWVTSVGWDIGKRELALSRAVVCGHLPAPAAAALLPAPEVAREALSDHDRQQLQTVLGLLAEGEAARRHRAERAEQERLGAEMALDIEIQHKVDQHLLGGDA